VKPRKLDVPPVTSHRLDLVSMSPEFMHLSLAGDLLRASEVIGAELPEHWPGRTGRAMRYRLVQLDADSTEQPWLLRAMVVRTPVRRVIGHIGFHAPPDARGALEIGYTVEPPHRRQGYAFEAAQALFAWAKREHGIHRFIASIAPTNEASLALAHKMGFHQTGSQWDDEDGEELVFELVFI
jgi:RimJ/RimL family protein N-acetyltransferase